MSDQATATGEQATQTPAPAAEQTTTTEPAVDQQAKANDFDAQKIRRKQQKLEKENEHLRQQLQEKADAAKTDAEKALTEAEKRGAEKTAAEYEAKLAAMETDAAIDRQLLDKVSLPEDPAEREKALQSLRAAVKAQGIEDAEDIPGATQAVINAFGLNAPARKGIPGQGGAPNTGGDAYPKGGQWTIDQVAEVRQRGEWSKYAESIKAWRRGGGR